MGVSKHKAKARKPKAKKAAAPAKKRKPIAKKKPPVPSKKSSPKPVKKKAAAKKMPPAKKPAAKKPPAASVKTAGKAPAAVSAKGKSVPVAAKAAAVKAAPLKKGAAPVLPVPDNVKRPSRPLFIEVKPGAERVIKRGDKTLVAAVPLDIQARRKGVTSEETPEELVVRIERELEHQFFFKRNAVKPQMCTKCGMNPVAERFTLDKELGYCDDCAKILRLGESKESRRMEVQPVAKKEGDPASAPKPPGGEDEEGDIKEEVVPDID